MKRVTERVFFVNLKVVVIESCERFRIIDKFRELG